MNIQEIKKRIRVNTLKTLLWSQIAAVDAELKSIVTAQMNWHQAIKKRKDRELIILIHNEEEKAESNWKTIKAVLKVIWIKKLKKVIDNIIVL